ncbi:hypothetical protein WME99_47795 [Sorangium sp. So ce136]
MAREGRTFYDPAADTWTVRSAPRTAGKRRRYRQQFLVVRTERGWL